MTITVPTKRKDGRTPRKTRIDMNRNKKNSLKNIHERPKNRKNIKNAQKLAY